MIFQEIQQGSCRAYLVGSKESRDVIIIDPRIEFVPSFLELLEKNNFHLTHVIDTHTHADHLSGAPLLVKETGCLYGMHRASPVSVVSLRFDDASVLTVGDSRITVLSTPGHSKDSISILLPERILTGDTLFLDEGGAGRDDLYGGDPGEHWESLQRLGGLPENLIVYPAHEYRGRQPSTLKQQKKSNPHLRYESKISYIDFAKGLQFGPAAWMEEVVKSNIVGAADIPAAVTPDSGAGCEANPCEQIVRTCESVGSSALKISPEQLRLKINGIDKPMLLDVREADELNGVLGCFSDSIHIPIGKLSEQLAELYLYKEQEIITICKTGGRAQKAAAMLANAGFGKVAVLDGGMTGYRHYEMQLDQKNDQAVIYLDHAATTYLDSEVRLAMEPFWEQNFGNPSSIYSLGRNAAAAIEQARDAIAALLNARPSEIIFTAGGTESINLAIFGVVQKYLVHNTPCHIITSRVEHSAVLKSFERLAKHGCATTYLGVDEDGFVNFDELANAIRPDTVLISIMYANNEIGTVYPIAAIASWLQEVNKTRGEKGLPKIMFHSDACQAAGFLEIDVQKLGVDLLTVNGSKIYGPKQTGILYCREGTVVQPLIVGGGQERNMRSGTENVAGIVGFAKALSLAQERRLEESGRLRELRDYVLERVFKEIPGVRLNGPKENRDSRQEIRRLPNNINISLQGVRGEDVLFYLDQRRICVSTGSACSSKDHAASHVLAAIRCPDDYIGGSLRLTLGKKTIKQDLDYAIQVLQDGVSCLRRKESAL